MCLQKKEDEIEIKKYKHKGIQGEKWADQEIKQHAGKEKQQ